MFPVLFSIGAWQIRSYYVFLVFGASLGVLTAGLEARRIGFSQREILTFCAAVIPGALIGGLLNGWLFAFDTYRALAIGHCYLSGGLISFGIILGAYLIGWLFAIKRKKSVGMTLDLISLSMPIILFFSRIGCLLNGCCYGRETSGFGGVYLPGAFGVWAYRYPTQIILLFLDVGLFIWLWSVRKRKLYEGSLTLNFLIVFSVGRLLIDSFRDLPLLFGLFSLHQMASLIILLAAMTFYFIHRRRQMEHSGR